MKEMKQPQGWRSLFGGAEGKGTPIFPASLWKQPLRDDIQELLHRKNVSEGKACPTSCQHDKATSRSNRLKHKLYFLSDTIVGVDLLVVFLAASLLTRFAAELGPENPWLSRLTESKAAVGTLGAFYSFALVFRTNICYSRWWEGRTLWGTMIVYSIRLQQQGRLWISDKELGSRLGRMAIIFAYTCKAQLRGNSIKHDLEEGAKLVSRGVLSLQELDAIHCQGAWQPYYCIDAMREIINEGLLRVAYEENVPDWMKNAAMAAMENTVSTLSSSIGGCIRVKSTGLPVAYDDILNAIGGTFFVVACAAWAPGAGPYNPFIVLTVYIVIKMIVGVGNDMEDPFGHDESDLPLEKFCSIIERQINAINQRAAELPFSLSQGPPMSGLMESPYCTFSSTATQASSIKSSDDSNDIKLETDALLA